MEKGKNNIIEKLKKIIKGEVLEDESILKEYSHDASILEITPKIVVFPKDEEDVMALVRFAEKNKISLTARAGGTDMTGGPLTEQILVVFPKYLNKLEMKDESVVVGPGTYYRDLEKAAREKKMWLPSYPASKSICCLGGMISNNSGGEKTIVYGKTNDYISKLKVVLSDGNEYEFGRLNKKELSSKMRKNNFEGRIYRKMYNLIEKNYDLIKQSKPDVQKNSAGYYLWNVWDRKNFDLTQLFCGSQGTLGLITEAEMKLVNKKEHSRLIVCFIKTTGELTEFVNTVLPYGPESLETFDDATLRLAIKFMPEIARKIGKSRLGFLWSFRREMLMSFFSGIPKFSVLIEMADDNEEALAEKIEILNAKLKEKKVKHIVMKSEKEGQKYWTIRRESFNLLRKKVKDKHAAAFIDDFAVKPEHLPEFWPKLEEVLKRNDVQATIAGHAGSGNFHIIPLMDLSDEKERGKIHKVSDEVYSLVAEYKGTITAEHNDGLIRTPYLDKMFSPQMIKLFEQTKKIFDPHEIFNPGKKVHGNMDYTLKHIRTNWD
jgi:FAD/FMN-containing dehydrogenase